MNVEVEKLLQIIGALTVENAMLQEQIDAQEEPVTQERRPLSEVEVAKMKQVASEA